MAGQYAVEQTRQRDPLSGEMVEVPRRVRREADDPALVPMPEGTVTPLVTREQYAEAQAALYVHLHTHGQAHAP